MEHWLEKFIRWISGSDKMSPSASRDLSQLAVVRWLLVLLLVALACLVGVMLVRMWRRRQSPEEITAQTLPPVPDLTDENVGADQLPEDGWVKLARELLERGELRLALRAFYLASLAHLAERNLVSLAKFKSNRDYERELVRRQHALPEVTQRFSENVFLFDSAWYGLHEVTREGLDRFAENVERIKAQT